MIKINESIYNFSISVICMAAFIIIISAGNTSGQTSSDQGDIFSPENRLEFGDYLFCQKDYLRAINEYQNFLKFSNNDTARFKFAFALAEIGRSTEALDNYKGLFFSSSVSEAARLEFYKVNFLTSEFQDFRDICEKESYLPEEHKPEIERLKQYTYLLDNVYLPDSSEFISVFAAEDRKEISSLFMKKKFPDYKSPAKAAILSALIPGAGKIYTENWGDGITAFLATGVLTFLAYDNYKAHHKYRALIFAGLAAASYAGNIYGSAASAQIYNAGIQFNFEQEVKVYLNKKNYFIPSPDFLCD